MPIISKYSNEEVNNLVEAILSTIEQQQKPVDLNLIALGNVISNIIDTRFQGQQKKAIAASFADALLNSIKD